MEEILRFEHVSYAYEEEREALLREMVQEFTQEAADGPARED